MWRILNKPLGTVLYKGKEANDGKDTESKTRYRAEELLEPQRAVCGSVQRCAVWGEAGHQTGGTGK